MALALSEQVLAAFQAGLLNQIAGIDERVVRDREDAYGEDEFAIDKGGINIKPDDEASRIMGENADDNEITVNVEIYVRAAQDDPWTKRANAFAVLVHARLMTAGVLPGFLARVRKIGTNWGGDESGRTPGKLTLKYAARYLSHARALDSAPNQP